MCVYIHYGTFETPDLPIFLRSPLSHKSKQETACLMSVDNVLITIVVILYNYAF